jgi:hypothetical protein
MKSRTKIALIALKVPLRAAKHVAVINEANFLIVCRASPEDSLTVVLMIGPNIEEVHPQKRLPIRNHVDSRRANIFCWTVRARGLAYEQTTKMHTFIGTAYSRRKFEPQVRMTVDETVRETYPLGFRYGEPDSFCKEATHVFIGKDIRACGIVRQLYNIVPAIIGSN